VTFATERKVFDNNYGVGEDSGACTAQAYLLIYIREAIIKCVLAPVTDVNVLPYLSSCLAELLSWKVTD